MNSKFEMEYLQVGLKIAYYRKLRGLTSVLDVPAYKFLMFDD